MTLAPPNDAGRGRILAGIVLAMLMALLTLRMTQSETVREPLSQKRASVEMAARGAEKEAAPEVPQIGPAVIVGESVFTFALAAVAAGLAIKSGRMSNARLGQFALIAVVLTCGGVSTWHAENKFNAIVGLSDLGMALAAGWTVALVCGQLGDSGRRAVIAGLVGIGAIWIAKAYLQKYIEFPDFADYLRQHPEEIRRFTGIDDPVQMAMYKARMNSREVFGFISFANVFAAGMVGLLGVITAVLAAWFRRPRDEPPALVETKKPRPQSLGEKKDGEIPLDGVCFVVACTLLVLGLFVPPMTDSMGGMATGYAAIAVIIAAAFFRRAIVAHRRLLITLASLAIVLGTAAVVSYGIRNDRLPTRSLLFRWHYWTATAPIIRQSPAWGVGLNNFGDYYLQFKRPSSPEDVKDPHSFFLRLAAEIGIPAAAIIGGLLLWMALRGLRPRPPAPVNTMPQPGIGAFAGLGGAVATAWVIGHFAISESVIQYYVEITLILAVIGIAAYVTAIVLTGPLVQSSEKTNGGRITLQFITAATVIAALAMAVYDQINMALVTGPVAMLFWMMLGLGDSHQDAPAPAAKPLAGVVTLTSAAVALVLAAMVWIPLLRGQMAWDPAPYEYTYIERAMANDVPAARAALDAALARTPRSTELLSQKIQLLQEKYPAEPVAPLIRRLLTLDHANARIRAEFALRDSDLPAAERARYLQEALDDDDALEADEKKRLPAELREQVRRKRAALSPP